jgi:hypothetical protein
MKSKEQENKKIVVYKDKKNNVQIKVDVDKDTVWLTQKEMAVLFGCSVDNIILHLKNIYKEKELIKEATTEKSSVVQHEKGRLIKRNLNYYNLDAIISVGYRIKSSAATTFRI